jgi:HAD superfamily hydrolase (TIGR01459 family)
MENNASDFIPILESIAPLAPRYDVWLLDIWGVLHNGVRPFPGAVDACRRFRQKGGVIILVSNSPRPRQGVIEQLTQIGVPEECYDGVVTSGDVTRTLVSAHAGETVFHLGPERDKRFFDGIPVAFGDLDDSTAVVCTGLVDDDTETPDNYIDIIANAREMNLEFICANPDIIVERGDKLIYCAGALAKNYAELGGSIIYAGKPHAPIYDLALALSQSFGGFPRHRVVAIGDGIRTDIAGAVAQGIDAIFIASTVHITGALTPESLAYAFAGEQMRPVAALSQLAW